MCNVVCVLGCCLYDDVAMVTKINKNKIYAAAKETKYINMKENKI